MCPPPEVVELLAKITLFARSHGARARSPSRRMKWSGLRESNPSL